MKYVNEQKIYKALEEAKNASDAAFRRILTKSKSLKRLSLKEAAVLLCASGKKIKDIFSAATFVKNAIYGHRVVIFAPLYISNICGNDCLYCAFRSSNRAIKRKILTIDEIKQETLWLLKHGHKRILLVAAEPVANEKAVDYYVQAIRAVYAVRYKNNYIRRVNINCAPLSINDFKKLKAAGIGTYQIFQETYHSQTYNYVHPCGPKSDADNRISAIDRAFKAGIDDVGVGVLYGLYDYKFETLALLSHIESLEEKFGIGPHTISVPRIEPAAGVEFSNKPPYELTDKDFKKVVAILRLAVPYTGIILSTRERAKFRDSLFNLGVSQVSAASSTSPGGYTEGSLDKDNGQFSVSDNRSLDQVVGSLIKKNMIPSFCTACYRSKRTGRAFMSLAKPGTIKGMCSINALITLKEYLDDFASSVVKKAGYKLIGSMSKKLNPKQRNLLMNFFKDMDKGKRDKYI